MLPRWRVNQKRRRVHLPRWKMGNRREKWSVNQHQWTFCLWDILNIVTKMLATPQKLRASYICLYRYFTRSINNHCDLLVTMQKLWWHIWVFKINFKMVQHLHVKKISYYSGYTCFWDTLYNDVPRTEPSAYKAQSHQLHVSAE